MARVGRDEADRAVQVFVVVPIGEGFHPSLRIGFAGKTFAWLVWAVFEGPKQGFREWVVIADARAAVGRRDAQLFHSGFNRGTFHGAAVVGVQHKRTHEASFSHYSLPNQCRGML